MPILLYTKMMYLPEHARRKSSISLLRKDDVPHANLDNLLACQAAGNKLYTCKYGTYDLLEILKLIPEQTLQTQLLGINDVHVYGHVDNLVNVDKRTLGEGE